MLRSPRLLVTVAAAMGVLAASVNAAPAYHLLEPGFTVTPFASTGGTPTSLAFGPGESPTLYVTEGTNGAVLAVDPTGLVTTFAEGFRTPLGVVVGADGSVYVSDVEAAREGPYGLRGYGRVWRLRDTDGDGVADKRNVVLKDLPNGRHNTNGLAFGPDGLLYVANGNSTDDGIDGGETEVEPWSGSVVRVSPRARKVSVSKLPSSALVAQGWRNVYDLAFSPVDPTKVFVPMNGVDDARQGSTGENPADPELEDSDDLLFVTDVDDRKVDDFAFPQCLYNLAERGDLKPYQNPNQAVIERFGRCRKRVVPRPVASFGLHPSANGLAFQTTGEWGDDYRNDLFVTEWGSLFGPPSGHKVVRVELDETGTKVTAVTDFLETDTPLDVTFHPDGSMYVADYSGTIFKVTKAV